jgi:hypothetical protein
MRENEVAREPVARRRAETRSSMSSVTKAKRLKSAAVSVGAFVLCSTPALHGQAVTDSVVAVTAVEDAYGHWSPDGRRIVFQSNRTGQWDIYVIDAGTAPASPFRPSATATAKST